MPPRPRNRRAAGGELNPGTAATVGALAGAVTAIGVGACGIITATAEPIRSRADLARARREGAAEVSAASPGAGPEPVPGEAA
ncbi:hypothetical protein ACFVVL_16865 [Kitasatospora sp. NPDC058115]|uniref:hypothetical protein n=1 Tax=Kitasatospora sp. NPDC058115 TaxID=3346347 RepID=UPI0036D7BB3C